MIVRRLRTASAVYGAVLGKQPDADKTLGQLAIGLFSDEFVAGVTPPEINAADLEKLAGGVTKELDQRGGVGAFRSLGGDSQEELLKSIVGDGQSAAFRQRRRIDSSQTQSVTGFLHRFS